ncbi:uncharacterized protein At2g39795, mitochondrial-like [Salvia miltiorrhiza]|uniref:uncharacterized protein At2g39795, mitochondrial-like n=1 Tax=Salvia miltiorrhiza TaxID=226208 RepID=UPI0025AC4EAC|nr:uncharacterized protein At2g39795, mitochondrial-like [Salvia miltiorrhiza]
MLRAASTKLFRARNTFSNPLLCRRRFSAAAPFERYVIDAHKILADALDSEIKHTQMISLRPAAPADFPFKLQHTPSERVKLTRELDGEEIEVMLLGNDQNHDADEDDGATTTDSDSDTDDCPDSDEESPAKSATDLIIKISKPNGKSMKFFATASRSADKIEIQRLTTKDGDGDNNVVCSQLFIAPESELQMALREFLEVRGIKKSIAKFLYDYMNWKSKLPYDGVLRSVEAYSAEKSVQDKNIRMLRKLKKIIKDW